MGALETGAVGAGGAVAPPTFTLTAADGFDESPATIPSGGSGVTAADVNGVTAADRSVVTGFVVTSPDSTVSSGGTVELMATASGPKFVMPAVAVPGSPGPPPVAAVPEVVGQRRLRDNPISRVDFYAAVDTDGSDGDEALKYIGSVDGGLAGAEDYVDAGNNMRRYIYTLSMTAAEFLAKVGGTGDYGTGMPNNAWTAGDGAIVAFAVKDNKGVALRAVPMEIVVAK